MIARAIIAWVATVFVAGCASEPYVHPNIKFETGQRVCGASDGKSTTVWGCT